VATSGIGRRSWLGRDGRPAHHLLDPATGRPAFTGIVQATAIAPTALEAELRAKAAVRPPAAAGWLEHGGAVVYDDGGVAAWSARGRPARQSRRTAGRPRPRPLPRAAGRSCASLVVPADGDLGGRLRVKLHREVAAVAERLHAERVARASS
jgi:hypothetical protein